MELFRDRAHVRLRSRVHGAYLYADEDGVGVSLSGRRESINAVWAVHRVQRGGTGFILLHSAAYGKYLAFSPEHRRYAGRARGAVQSHYFNDKDQKNIMWVAMRKRDGDVFIRNRGFGHWYSPNGFTIMSWVVEAVPSRGSPPLLPPIAPVALQQNLVLPQRMILYMKGDDYGNIDYGSTKLLIFKGHSVSRLRDELAFLLEEWHSVRITMCVWAGSHGRLTPLVVDLPHNSETMEVVVFESWSRAAPQGLQYPNVKGSRHRSGHSETKVSMLRIL